jgi:hypothetical protein
MHLANGLRVSEIADKLFLSESAINKTLNAARNNVGARTLPHLVSIVIAQNLLYWTDEGRSTEDPEQWIEVPSVGRIKGTVAIDRRGNARGIQ